MVTYIKKGILGLMLIVLLVTQTGCLELYGRYETRTTLSYLATISIVHYAALYSVAMISALTQSPVRPGSSTPHSFVFSPPGDSLLTYQILVSFSTAFLFNTFGSPGNTVGEYRIVDPAGALIRTALIIALTATSAYIDLNNNLTHQPEFEPEIAYQNAIPGALVQTLLITFPLWAGGDENLAAYALTDFAIFTLFAGILTNPSAPGLYTTKFNFTSIDPDSGGADDNSGDDPVFVEVITKLRVYAIMAPIIKLLLLN